MRLKNVPGKLATRWQEAVRARLQAAGQTARFHYHRELESTGTGVDRYLGEGLDGRTPFAVSGQDLTYSGLDALVVSGHYISGLSGGTSIRDKDILQNLGIGEFQPGDLMFVADASGLAASSFHSVRYVTLDGLDDRRYRLVGTHKVGMMGMQFWHLLLRQTNITEKD